jgi:YfiH family protein
VSAGAAPGRASVPHEAVDDFAPFGIRAFTTTREAGSFSTTSDEPVREVMGRWDALREMLSDAGPRLATARQVHGARVVVHGAGWDGWLRGGAADGHVSVERGTAMAVSVADCVPAFLAHPSGATAVLHSGWRGTAGRIVEQGVLALAHRGIPPRELHLHLGPAICGKCYEVSPEVYGQVTGRSVDRPTPVDLRLAIADHARAAGVGHVTVSDRCTRCDNDRFYSHRAGDAGRQLGIIVAEE